jgi:hypothetical protein
LVSAEWTGATLQIAESGGSRGFQPPEEAQSARPLGPDRGGRIKYDYAAGKQKKTETGRYLLQQISDLPHLNL